MSSIISVHSESSIPCDPSVCQDEETQVGSSAARFANIGISGAKRRHVATPLVLHNQSVYNYMHFHPIIQIERPAINSK